MIEIALTLLNYDSAVGATVVKEGNALLFLLGVGFRINEQPKPSTHEICYLGRRVSHCGV